MVKHRRKSNRRKSLRRKSNRRKSLRRKSNRRKSNRRRKLYGGKKYTHMGKIDAFCGKDSILKKEYRSCDDRLLAHVDIKNDENAMVDAFGHLPFAFGKLADKNGKIDGVDPQEWILNKIKTKSEGDAMHDITLDNLVILKGFYGIQIDQSIESSKDIGTFVFTNSDILLDEYKANSGEKIMIKYPKKKDKRDLCEVEPHCYRFSKGIGPIVLKSALEQQDANKRFILLEASGGEGLVEMYKNKYGFGEPVIINYTHAQGVSIIMYATIKHVIDTIDGVNI